MPVTTRHEATSTGRASRRPDGWALLALPGVAFLLVVFGVPICVMVALSLTDPSPQNYQRLVQDPLVGRSLLYTFELSLAVTAVCFLIGYPWAYLLNSTGSWKRAILFALVIVPFWSSLLVRTYAWSVILRETGLLNGLLVGAHLLSQPVAIVGTSAGTAIGMTQILLPFMVLPIYAVMRQIDSGLVPAAQGLGAHPLYAFFRVFFPLSLPGVLAGCLLVFVVSLGFYITPAILGSIREPMFSQVIVIENQTLLQAGFASAMAVLLLFLTLIAVWLGSRVVDVTQALGLDDRG